MTMPMARIIVKYSNLPTWWCYKTSCADSVTV